MNDNVVPQDQLDLTAYVQRRDKGLIFWTTENGVAVMNIKQFNLLHEEIPAKKIAFTTHQIGSSRNEADRQILNLKDQVLALQGQIAKLESDKVTVYDELEKDVIKAIEDEAKSEHEAE